MPETGEDAPATERDVAGANDAIQRRDDLRHIENFVSTASAEEVTHVKKLLVIRARALGISTTRPKPKKTDRVFARLAVELVPILLTVFVVFPLVMWGVLRVMGNPFFQSVTAGCPPTCEANALALWAVVSGVGFLLIILAYYSIRKVMIRARM